MTTDQEQDLLRAMLVMASAGLDATIKRLIADSLPRLAVEHDAVREGLQKFIARQIRREAAATAFGTDLIAHALSSSSPQAAVINAYINDLTGDSLQSADQVFKSAAALGLTPQELGLRQAELKDIFDLRNQIIHELDIDLDNPRRRRHLRRLADMTAHADEVLRIAREFVMGVARLTDAVAKRTIDAADVALHPPVYQADPALHRLALPPCRGKSARKVLAIPLGPALRTRCGTANS